ncbi:hypothetical protein KY308_04235 [Candidatus Woesearchaeota archaeon]|nr:hypothetical protein [Candidatus Woesearchaeota archaeon]
MIDLTYLAVLILSFLGIFAGVALALIAPEELKSGRKYWIFSKLPLLLVIIFLIFYYSIIYSNIITAIVLSAALIFLRTVKKEYHGFALILFFSSIINRDFLFLAGAAIFIYGMLIGTLDSANFIKKRDFNTNKKLIKKILVYTLKENVLYLILGVFLLPFGAYI